MCLVQVFDLLAGVFLLAIDEPLPLTQRLPVFIQLGLRLRHFFKVNLDL